MDGKQVGDGEIAMGPPQTRYASAGDVNIAYQVVGEGPIDLVWAWGLASNIEVAWEEPSYAAFLRRLSEYARVILFDRRGCGASDREGNTVTPTLEERMHDVLAVLDAVGSEQGSIFGFSEGGALAALFAATHPDRTTSVILYGTMARFLRDAEHPWGWADEEGLAAFHEQVQRLWGTPEGSEAGVPWWAPSMAGDARFKDWLAKHTRQSVSRSAILPLMRSQGAYDLVDVFPAVRVPALVLHRRDDVLVPVSHGRHIAEQIPDARYVELSGVDHFPFVGDTEEVLVEVEDFLVGSRTSTPRHRRLLTLVFTDIADSTVKLADLGDDAWRELLAAHDQAVRTHLSRFAGEEVKHLGDGFLAMFDGPARAIRCALGIVDAAAKLGLSTRVGLHTGECEVVDADVQGIAVHVGARIAEHAAPGEILVSSTVRDLVAGSGIRFGEARDVELQGVAGPRVVFPVLSHGVTPDTVRRLAIDQANVLRRDGEYWTVAYDGQVATLRDAKGVRDIARLLASPHNELHALDLVAEGGTPLGAVSGHSALAAGLSIDTGGNQPILDDAARADYKRRIAELEQEVDNADDRGDGEGSAKARQELETLVDTLASAYGFGGRSRRTPDSVERARKAVTRRIRDALGRIEHAHPVLGRHLHASLRTGVFCSYAPEREVVWTVEANPT
jgi:pimeloyl-ACP methyl ester carboxylesterase